MGICAVRSGHRIHTATGRGVCVMSNDGIIFVVDDDMRVLISIETLLTAVGYQVRPYDSGELFLEARKPETPCCVILDLNLGTSSGLDVQRQLSHEVAMPLIFLSGYGDVRTTVEAMKAGAYDFLTKPIEEDKLLSTVECALQHSRLLWEECKIEREIRRRYRTLTPREQYVLPFIVRGLLNKQTAYELGTSEITIRIHRGSIMKKMRADSLADLVRFACRLGIPQGLAWGARFLTGPPAANRYCVAQATDCHWHFRYWKQLEVSPHVSNFTSVDHTRRSYLRIRVSLNHPLQPPSPGGSIFESSNVATSRQLPFSFTKKLLSNQPLLEDLRPGALFRNALS
jgi:FixJ family two-component response regulator